MADTKITALTAISTVDPAVDVLPIVDVSDTTMAASGTTKKITSNQILGAGGTATLASATITGDLTVDTSTLYVSSSADKVGIGTTSLSNEKLTVAGNISANAWLGRSNISVPAGDCSIFRSADNTLGFGIASSTAMTLNATGLGVGGSPFSKLSIIDTTNNFPGCFRGSGGGNTNFVAIGTTTLGASINGFTAGFAATADLILQPNGGNVGVGVTPSAWGAPFKGFDISTGGGIGGSSTSLRLFSNAYYNGSNYIYKNSAAAARYDVIDNTHNWYVAPGGTAGNAITWTQAMALDSNGNLIWSPATTAPTLGTNGQLTVNATSNTNLRFSYRGSDGVTRVANLTLA